MKEIPLLGKGGNTLVDDDFEDNLPVNGWHQSRTGYVQRGFWIKAAGRGTTRMMHRLIMNAPTGMEVDHIDGDKLNNQRSNLRLCTHRENQRNRKKANKNSSSGAKGVYLDRRTGEYYAQVSVNGKSYNVGRGFKTIKAAAICRDASARSMHGDFFSPSSLLTEPLSEM